MILWKDFVLDDALGPVLLDRDNLRVTRSRVMEDASARALIQETRRDAQPLSATNTGCVRGASWTEVHAPGSESNLETNAPSYTEVGNELAGLSLSGVG